MKHPCIGCGLRYSSYCMGCKMKLFGIGALPIPEHEPKRQKSKMQIKTAKLALLQAIIPSIVRIFVCQH